MKRIEVVAAIIRREGLYLATQRGYGAFEGMWEFPGGKIEPGENPQEALVREIREELDMDIRVGELFCVREFDYPDFPIWCCIVIYARCLTARSLHCLSTRPRNGLTRRG